MFGSTVSLPSLIAGRAGRRLRGLVEGLGFWTAVVLPFLYLPSIALGGLVSVPPEHLAAALAVNVLALLVGHRHGAGHSQG